MSYVYVVVREWQDSGGDQYTSIYKVFKDSSDADKLAYEQNHKPSKFENQWFYVEEHEVN